MSFFEFFQERSWLILAAAGTGTFTYTRFHIPRAPTAPAMAPVARPGPGGLGANWLAQIRPDPAMPACRRRRKLPLGMTRRRGAWGGSVYDGYRLVPGSSRPAGVVT